MFFGLVFVCVHLLWLIDARFAALFWLHMCCSLGFVCSNSLRGILIMRFCYLVIWVFGLTLVLFAVLAYLGCANVPEFWGGFIFVW